MSRSFQHTVRPPTPKQLEALELVAAGRDTPKELAKALDTTKWQAQLLLVGLETRRLVAWADGEPAVVTDDGWRALGRT